MYAFSRAIVLRDKLRNEGLIELDAALDEAGQRWKEDVLEIAADRFERRLTGELSQLRVDVSKEIAAVRVDMAKELAAVRVDIGASRLSTIRWIAGLLIAHAGVMIGAAFAMMTFLVSALKAN